jgi:hypothetical protein
MIDVVSTNNPVLHRNQIIFKINHNHVLIGNFYFIATCNCSSVNCLQLCGAVEWVWRLPVKLIDMEGVNATHTEREGRALLFRWVTGFQNFLMERFP